MTVVFPYPNGSLAPVFIRSLAFGGGALLLAADLTPLESLYLRIGTGPNRFNGKDYFGEKR